MLNDKVENVLKSEDVLDYNSTNNSQARSTNLKYQRVSYALP